MSASIVDHFTGPELGVIAEFLRSSTGRRYQMFLLMSRPPIMRRDATAESVSLSAAHADGWEACVRFAEVFTQPGERKETPAFQDVSGAKPQ